MEIFCHGEGPRGRVNANVTTHNFYIWLTLTRPASEGRYAIRFTLTSSPAIKPRQVPWLIPVFILYKLHNIMTTILLATLAIGLRACDRPRERLQRWIWFGLLFAKDQIGESCNTKRNSLGAYKHRVKGRRPSNCRRMIWHCEGSDARNLT